MQLGISEKGKARSYIRGFFNVRVVKAAFYTFFLPFILLLGCDGMVHQLRHNDLSMEYISRELRFAGRVVGVKSSLSQIEQDQAEVYIILSFLARIALATT